MPPDAPPKPIPLSVRRMQHEADGKDYAHLQFDKTDGRGRGYADLSLSAFKTGANLQNALADEGYDLPTEQRALQSVLDDTRASLPDEAGLLCISTGWKKTKSGESFLLPDGPISACYPDQPLALAKGARALCVAKGDRGTLRHWRFFVAGLAGRSDYAAMSMLTSLAGPLVAKSQVPESLILNLAGNSSSGKTTANAAATSLWGQPMNLPDWNVSGRALEEVAAANSGTCLPLDDIERGEGDGDDKIAKLRQATHRLTSGKGRTVSTFAKQSGQLPQLDFSGTVICSSPRTLESHSPNRSDGDRARLLEVSIPHGDEGGIWRGADLAGIDYQSTRELSERLFARSQKYFGVAGRAWVEFLVENLDGLSERISRHITKFMGSIDFPLSSVQGRIAGKIGLLYAAGRLARKAGVIAWTKDRILNVTHKMLREVLAASFASQKSEQYALRQIRAAMTDESRFPAVWDGVMPSAHLGREGVVRSERNQLLITPAALDTLLAKACATAGKGLAASIRRKMFDPKVLLSGKDDRRTDEVRVGGRKQRFLVFNRDSLLLLLSPVEGAPGTPGAASLGLNPRDPSLPTRRQRPVRPIPS